jgi:hypothetical protein
MTAPVPTIHLNGTSGDALLRQIVVALTALRKAREAMCEGAPHGRDYYVQSDPDAFKKARAAHQNRLTRIEHIHDEIEKIGIAISEQPRRKPCV